MSTLKSALLGILPVAERIAPVSSGGAGTLLFQDNAKATQAGGGINGLKAILGVKKHVVSFKYNAVSDRLYAYFRTASEAADAFSYFNLYKSLVGNLHVQRSGVGSIRVDKASTFKPVAIEMTAKAQTFDEFVRDVKAAFQVFDASGTSLTYKVDKAAKRIYAYASSNRKNGAIFTQNRQAVAHTHKFHVVSAGEYNVTLRFDFDQKQEIGFNTLLTALKEEPALKEAATPVESTVYSRVANADPASKLEGLVPPETLQQVRRILAGERLPAPAPKPRFVTAGDIQLKLFVNGSKELDLAAQIAELNKTGKDSAVYHYGQIGYALFGTQTVHNPLVVLMRDYNNPKGAFVVLRTPSNYHMHFQIKQV